MQPAPRPARAFRPGSRTTARWEEDAIRRISKYLPLKYSAPMALNAAHDAGKVANILPEHDIIDVEPKRTM